MAKPLDLLHMILNPHEMTGDAAMKSLMTLLDQKIMKRTDLVVHIEKFRTTNDCSGESGYDSEIENRCMDALDALEKIHWKVKEARKQMRKSLRRETRWREQLGEEVVDLRRRVIEMEDKLDPAGAPKRAADRAMKQAMAEQETRCALFGSGESSEITGLLG